MYCLNLPRNDVLNLVHVGTLDSNDRPGGCSCRHQLQGKSRTANVCNQHEITNIKFPDLAAAFSKAVQRAELSDIRVHAFVQLLLGSKQLADMLSQFSLI